jgi:predicted transcriptional regulator
MSHGTAELHDVLSKRADVLKRIHEREYDASDLRRETEMADSTVYKSLRELEDVGLITNGGGGYDLTAYGKEVYQKHEEMSRVCKARPVLEGLGEDFDLDMVSDADTVLPEPHAPQKPVSRMEDMVNGSETVRGLAPVVTERYVRFARRKAVEGMDAEFVLEKDVFEHVRRQYPKMLEDQLENGVSVYVTDRTVPYGLLVSDTGVCVISYDGEGGVLGGVVSDRVPVRDKGDEVFSKYRRGATKVRRKAV